MTDPNLAKKQHAARAALRYLQDDMILGVGTGSTVNALIEQLVRSGVGPRLRGAVASSESSAQRLRSGGITVLDLNEVASLPLYIDGADEANRSRQLIKGGGGALTREKIVAAAATRFICIIDDSKLVQRLGGFPLPVEVIPMARSYVARRLEQLGGRPVWRRELLTDNGNHILDVHDLPIDDPIAREVEIGRIAGVVCVGIFAARPADLLLIAHDADVETL